MNAGKSIGLLGCALVAALTLGGCREEEQDRVLRFNKGEYAGRPDQPLTAEAREALKERMRHQGGLGGVDHGPAARQPAVSGGDVRPPVMPEGVRERSQGQSPK
jgi:hypothetical protein